MINADYIKDVFKKEDFQRLNFTFTDKKWRKDPGIDYSCNSLGFRDDEFEEFKEGHTRFLFAGCSMTEGVGLPRKYMWSENVKKNIQQTDTKTQFYNIGMGGASTQLIIKNVVNFIKKYYNNITSENINLETLFFYDANILILLEEFCKTNNIKLFLMSWHYQTYKLYNETGLKFYKILDHGVHPMYFIKNIKQYKDPLLFRGSDQCHPGGLWHFAVADMITNHYEKEKNEDIRNK
jgi:hypothetical protein